LDKSDPGVVSPIESFSEKEREILRLGIFVSLEENLLLKQKLFEVYGRYIYQ
jgi:hypothetical protein